MTCASAGTNMLSELKEYLPMDIAAIIDAYVWCGMLVQSCQGLVHFDGEDRWQEWEKSFVRTPLEDVLILPGAVRSCFFRTHVDNELGMCRVQRFNEGWVTLSSWYWTLFVSWNGNIAGCLNTASEVLVLGEDWNIRKIISVPFGFQSPQGMVTLHERLFIVLNTQLVSCDLEENWREHAWSPVFESTGFALVSWQGHIYVFGGCQVSAFDPRTNLWQQKAGMLSGRDFVSAVVSGDKVYLFGGFFDMEDVGFVDCYHLVRDVWHRKGDSNLLRGNCSAAAHG